jgi:hypothetical protein
LGDIHDDGVRQTLLGLPDTLDVLGEFAVRIEGVGTPAAEDYDQPQRSGYPRGKDRR